MACQIKSLGGLFVGAKIMGWVREMREGAFRNGMQFLTKCTTLKFYVNNFNIEDMQTSRYHIKVILYLIRFRRFFKKNTTKHCDNIL